MSKKITMVDARNKFSTILNQAALGKERIVFTRRGESIAAIIPLEDLELLEELEDLMDIKLARESLIEIKMKGTIPWEDLKKELGL